MENKIMALNQSCEWIKKTFPCTEFTLKSTWTLNKFL